MDTDPARIGWVPTDIDGEFTPRVRDALDALAALDEMVVVMDDTGTIVWVNDAWHEFGRRQGATDELIRGVGVHIRDAARIERHRVELEAELSRAARARSMARLAGGVAHNLNNLLGVILGHTDLALSVAASDDPVRAELAHIRDATERSARLIRQLLTFAGRQRVDPRPMDVAAAAVEQLPMLRELAGNDIIVTLCADDELWMVSMDPLQVELIITNLCINSRDAIAGSGRIDIEIANHTVGPFEPQRPGGPVPGDYVRVTVRDDGGGIAPEVLADIFDPFFTSRELNPGVGLGLASVHGAATQSGGFATVSSDGTRGATIDVYLPRHGAEVTSRSAELTAPGTLSEPHTILLVDDEPALLKATTRILAHHHYEVIAAGSAEEALRLLHERGAAVDLLLTDVNLPGMSGRRLAEEIESIRPGLPHLFMSGYASDVVSGTGELPGGSHFIAKPFRASELFDTLRELLEGDGA